MCSTLWCRVSPKNLTCVAASYGAVDGTLCAPGKVCSAGKCVETASTEANRTSCLYGDDLVIDQLVLSDPLPASAMTCDDVVSYLGSLQRSPLIYCSYPAFRQTCCQTCKSK